MIKTAGNTNYSYKQTQNFNYSIFVWKSEYFQMNLVEKSNKIYYTFTLFPEILDLFMEPVLQKYTVFRTNLFKILCLYLKKCNLILIIQNLRQNLWALPLKN